ncbi:MAG: hypothetical protein WCA37_00095 [Terracidiphilus sp.]
MITKASAFLDQKTSDGKLNDLRVRALLHLIEVGFSVEDLAMALNCSVSMVRSLLALPYRMLYLRDQDNPKRVWEPINLRMLPQPQCPIILNPRTASKDETARQQERHAQLLAIEILHWLRTFEASDQDRRQAIEQAGFLLDELPLKDGKLQFDSFRVFSEIHGIWRGKPSKSVDKSFGETVSPWLASWLRFWVSDPAIWNRALDLAYAHFGASTQAA